MQVLAGGTVRTVHPSGPATAEALAVDGDRIVAVGDEVEMVAAAGPRAEWVDLHGACVLPGFVDAHQHPSLIATDEHVGRLALPAGARMTELLGVIASLVAEGDGWVRAHGFDPLGLWRGAGRPRRSSTRSARTGL